MSRRSLAGPVHRAVDRRLVRDRRRRRPSREKARVVLLIGSRPAAVVAREDRDPRFLDDKDLEELVVRVDDAPVDHELGGGTGVGSLDRLRQLPVAVGTIVDADEDGLSGHGTKATRRVRLHGVHRS